MMKDNINKESKAIQIVKFPKRLALYMGIKVCNSAMNDIMELLIEFYEEGKEEDFNDALNIYGAFGDLKMKLVSSLKKSMEINKG